MDAVDTDKRNHPKTRMIADDIKNLNDQQTDLDEIEILDGSPPCIRFSVARAKKREQDIRLTMRETRLSFFASLVTASCSNIPIWVSVISPVRC